MNRILLLACISLTGCAYTKLADPRTGRTIMLTQGNFGSLDVTAPGMSLHAQGVDHSSATLAGGAAFAQSTAAVGAGATGIILGAGTSGLFTKGISTGRSLIVPTAAVATNVAARPTLPKSTPVPVRTNP